MVQKNVDRSLCIALIFHGMCSLIPALEKGKEISSTKAIIALQRRGRELFLAVNDDKIFKVSCRI